LDFLRSHQKELFDDINIFKYGVINFIKNVIHQLKNMIHQAMNIKI